MGQTMAMMEVKEGGHSPWAPHCKEMMAKPMMDTTPEGGRSNDGGTRTKKRAVMWFVASLFLERNGHRGATAGA
jgi:hypothetical protein